MKFRIKIMLCMLGLLSVLFGVGGSLLISTSFQASLEREKTAAFNAYQMVLGTMQIVNSINRQSDYDGISHTLEQLSEQNAASWTALRLSSPSQLIYEFGSGGFEEVTRPATAGNCTLRYLPANGGKHSLVLSGVLAAEGEPLYLDMARDISPLFETRRLQQQVYQLVFLLMAGLCALFSYSIAHLLTKPLVSLSKTSQAIASGQLESRAQIISSDEIGLVAQDFNVMAETLANNISQLEASVQRQERFLGSFAHEMKTPMTSIIGYADLIRGQTLSPEEQTEAANYIVAEGKRLENLSQKLLNLLLLQKTELVFVKVCPATLIQNMVQHLQAVYQQQEINLRCECEAGVCLLEPDLVKSLLLNLLDNARKAMEGQGGELLIESKMLPEGCLISVQDNGCGIPPAALGHLTEAFYRVDKSRAREQGGVGLGLSLCHEIVALHNGDIQFKSQVGRGTTVKVELRGGAA